MFHPIGTPQYSQKLKKKIIKIERFWNSDIESDIQDTTTSMHFLENLMLFNKPDLLHFPRFIEILLW